MQLLGDDPIVRAYEQLLCAAYKVSTHICFALSASYSIKLAASCAALCCVCADMLQSNVGSGVRFPGCMYTRVVAVLLWSDQGVQHTLDWSAAPQLLLTKLGLFT